MALQAGRGRAQGQVLGHMVAVQAVDHSYWRVVRRRVALQDCRDMLDIRDWLQVAPAAVADPILAAAGSLQVDLQASFSST